VAEIVRETLKAICTETVPDYGCECDFCDFCAMKNQQVTSTQ